LITFIKKKIGNDIDTINEKRTGRTNRLDRFFIISIILSAALLYIPFLWNFLFIDPWENHYSHVAWETLSQGSFAKLWFKNSNRFWSKPPFLFWMLMPLFKIHISEFTARLPIALFSLGTLSGFYILLTRLFTRKVAIISTFILMMSPHFFMMSRQVMVDLPFIGFNTVALLCMAIYYLVEFPENDKIWKIPRRDLYLYLFYFFEGWAFLSKGLLSVALPGTSLLIFMIFTRDFGWFFSWKHLKKHLIGIVVYLAVIFPWLGYMWASEGFEFIRIFIWFHHFKRVAGVIHKPNDLHTLYIRILGYSMFPWSAFLPAAIYHFAAEKSEAISKIKKLFILSLSIGPFFFLSFSGTKFYHYIAPIVPFLAILIGYYIDKIWKSSWKAATKVEMVIAVMLLSAIGRDIGNKYGIWLHIITFYNNRSLPRISSWLPVVISVFTVFALILFAMIFAPKIRKYGFYGLFLLTAGFMSYYFIVCMPVISTRYSIEPLVEKYKEVSPERAPIADYYKWLRKSVGFALRNEVTFLKTDKEKSVLRFFDKPGEQYVIMRPNDNKRFKSLMKRINKKVTLVKKDARNSLFKVTGPGKKRDFNAAKKYIVESTPSDMIKAHVVFDNVVELIGYKVVKGSLVEKDGKQFSKGGTYEFALFFKALQDNIKKDYDVFLHTEGDMKDKRTKGDKLMAEGTYPTTYWKKGQIIQHPLKVNIPKNSKNNYYIPYIGIYQEEYRGNISNPDEVPNDGDNRYELMKIYLEK